LQKIQNDATSQGAPKKGQYTNNQRTLLVALFDWTLGAMPKTHPYREKENALHIQRGQASAI